MEIFEEEIVKESHIKELKTKISPIDEEIKKLEKLKLQIICDHFDKRKDDLYSIVFSY